MTTAGQDMTAAIRRSIWEIRRMLEREGARQPPSRSLMGLSRLLDVLDFTATEEEGNSAFRLDEANRVVAFRSAPLRKLIEAVRSFALDAVGDDGLANTRMVQTATNLFVLHELVHVVQNFARFEQVASIRDGLGSLGLPILDVSADAAAAWACARIECDVAGVLTEREFLQQYVNALVLSYVVGAFVFDVRGRPEKMQRALGLLMSAALIQGKIEGYLDEAKLYLGWEPSSPIYAFDIEKARNLNALVLDRVPGLLMVNPRSVTEEGLMSIWAGIGRDPVRVSLEHISEALFAARVLVRRQGERSQGGEEESASLSEERLPPKPRKP
jgi:hypothetical protein